MNEIAIIGLGPAGVSAAIYLKRYGLNPICYEKCIIGGKVNNTNLIENYPGIPLIKGIDLGENLSKQISDYKIEVRNEEIISLSKNADLSFQIETEDGKKETYQYVIIAGGLNEKEFHIEGEDKFKKKGISRCAVCDGNFYKNKDVAIIGAGNSAFEEGIYLSEICSTVSLIARRNKFRADKKIVDNFISRNNTKIYSPYSPIYVFGEKSLERIIIKNLENNNEISLNIKGLFLYIGDVPNIDFIKINDLETNNGLIVTDINMKTNLKNLYAVGDCRFNSLKQIATAVSDGAIAASNIFSTIKDIN